jgi:2-polyprenyl-3-methyl-5-hydroxy-6-metoxy-1,4-benzoquinol methylase
MLLVSEDYLSKFRYFATCLQKVGTRSAYHCPSCGEKEGRLVMRKYVVTTLRRCSRCRLLFRTPTTNAAENAAFYQSEYHQGFTSDVPGEGDLQSLLECGFAGSEKDYSVYVAVLKALGSVPGERILDFGCSWGYGSWQLSNAGFKVTAYEISKPRCRYAREKLGVEAYETVEELPGNNFDVFFSAHVLEHVPSIREVAEFALTKLRRGGLFIAFTPNGSEAFRKREPEAWNQLWGMVHPNFLDDTFYRTLFPSGLLASTPYDLSRISNWRKNPRLAVSEDLSGSELLFASVKEK